MVGTKRKKPKKKVLKIVKHLLDIDSRPFKIETLLEERLCRIGRKSVV